MNGDQLAGKVAIVTGGGSGIGQAIARAYAEEGAAVVLAGRTLSRVEEVASELTAAGASALAIAADVTDETDVQRLFAEATTAFGRVDILVASAGVVKGGPPDEFSLEDWNEVMSVNVTGTFLSSREAFRTMKRQGDGGRIIIVGSIAAHRSRPHSAAYASSKHAVWGLTQALAIDGREFGISVSCLQPGNTQVERRADGRAHGGRDEGSETMMPSQDIARTALLMATLAPGTNLLEATVLPIQQPYIGRG